MHGHHFASEVTSTCPDDRFALMCRRSWLRLQHAMAVKLIMADEWLQHIKAIRTKWYWFRVSYKQNKFFILDIRLFGFVHNLLEQCRHIHRRKRSSMGQPFALSKLLWTTNICSTLQYDLAKTFIPPWQLSLIVLAKHLQYLENRW